MPEIEVPFQPLGYEEDAPYQTVQIDFWESEARTPAMVGAARLGKTMTGAGKMLANVLRHQTNGLIIGPTWRQTEDIALAELLKILPRELVYLTADGGVFHHTRQLVQLLDLKALAKGEKKPGPVIHCRSGEDPKAIYGFTCGTVWQDEAALQPEETFGAAVARCSDPPWQLFATFTPKGGRRNWANQKWALGLKSPVEARRGVRYANPDPQSPAWNMIYTDNYKMSDEWREMQETNIGLDTAYGRQELLGEVVDFAGLVFDMFDPKTHVKQMPEEFVRVAGGIDRAALGGTTAIKVIGLMPSGRVYSFFEWGKQHADISDIASVCSSLMVDPRCRGIVFHMDPHPQGEVEIASLQHWGIPVMRAAKKDQLDPGIRLMWSYLRVKADGLPGYFISPACPQTIAEYQSWCYVEGRGGGMISYEDVERRGKDFIDAERYAFMGLFGSQSAPPPAVQWKLPSGKLVGVR